MAPKDALLKELEAQNQALPSLIDWLELFASQVRPYRDAFDIHLQYEQPTFEIGDKSQQFDYHAATIRDCHYDVRKIEREINDMLSGRNRQFKALLRDRTLTQAGKAAYALAVKVVNHLGEALRKESVNVDQCFRLLDNLVDALDFWKNQADATFHANETALRNFSE